MKQSMILLHGLFGGLSNWSAVITHFEKRFDILVPMLPLHEKHTEKVIEYLTNFLELMIHKAKLDHVILIGNSLGGHVAIRYTHRNPNKVTRLILTGSSGLYENTQLGSFLKRGDYQYIRERVEATFYNSAITTNQMVEEVLLVTTHPSKCLSSIKIAKAAKLDNVLPLLPEISIPVLLVWGTEDQVTPPRVAYQFRDNFPNAKLVLLSECGHVPMMEKPEAFNNAVEEFLLV